MRKRPIAGMGIALALLAPPSQDATVHIVWNASPSVPIGLYGIVHRRPDVGELALVRLPDDLAEIADRRGYLQRSALLLKPVAAGAVDRVCRFGTDVFVQSRLVARAVVESEPLPSWRGCRTLSSSELFLLADHPASFDSRYFGPVHARHVIGTAIPLWRLQ
ncbi:S26 family signal peptidase [Hyphomicrobium zavarzinii]|uniref:S26 family signal peptidase n=1 Tax=Hyphomicrobium zavarzinii TaxID=48292 RepID=UPI0018DE5F98|nr:S26 family signal peptidase [Hyphomicrobium zavarzinii]